MFKEPAYWMYYFWSKNKRARKDKAVISNATWTMAILWFLNLTALHLLFEAWGWDMLTGWFSSLTDKVEWSRFNPVALPVRRSDARPFYLDCQKAVLPSCEAESDAGEVRDNGRIPETARSMPVLAVYYRQLRILLHHSRTKEPFQGATTDRKVAGDTGRQISR